MREDVQKWWEIAKRDLKAAEYNFNGQFFEEALFLSQQSAEKALKALYISRLGHLKRTHDLVLLAKKLDLPDHLIDFCKELSPAYTYSRYPDVPEIVEIREVSRNLLQYAKEVLNWVERML